LQTNGKQPKTKGRKEKIGRERRGERGVPHPHPHPPADPEIAFSEPIPPGKLHELNALELI
jgi:hypothetical protein